MQTSIPFVPNDVAVIADAAATVALTLCDACGFELTDRNKFCRQCGARQFKDSTAMMPLSTGESIQSQATRELATTELRGSLVIDVGSRSLTARLGNPVARTLVAALFAIPVWLIIVLLSPFDAWVSAKSAVNRTLAMEMKNRESNLCSEA
ncbi:MAG TPA: zinc ribbon domain-containing protein [Blastocatellia bacterium]